MKKTKGAWSMNTLTLEQQSKKQVMKAAISSLIGTFGSSIFTFGLSLMLLEKTGLAISFVLASVIQPILAIFLTPIVGPIVDRYDRKKVIIISQLVTLVILAIYGLYWGLSAHPQKGILLQSILLIIVLKATDQFTYTAQQAAKPDLVLSDDFMKLASYLSMATSISSLLTGVLGAVLYTLLPFWLFVFIEILTEIMTLFITLTMDFRLVHSQEDQLKRATESDKGSFLEGLRYIKHQKYLIYSLVFALLMNFFSAIINVGLPIIMLRTLKVSNVLYGLTETFFFVGMLVSAWLAGKIKDPSAPLERSRKLSYGYAVGYVGISLMVLLVHGEILAVIIDGLLLFAIAIVNNLMNIPTMVWLQREVPTHIQGRLMSTITTITMVASPLGLALFGALFDWQTTQPRLRDSLIFLGGSLAIVILITGLVKLLKLDLKEAKIFSEEEYRETTLVEKKESGN
ncbi:MFS transporter [Enterococcus lactis]|uniref:MFS transporter n=1 Tax=Enterococcus lactis TaxID=357441 RepID=UPI00355C56D5